MTTKPAANRKTKPKPTAISGARKAEDLDLGPKYINMQLTGDHIATVPFEVQTISPGGVHLAGIAIEKSPFSRVIAVGPGKPVDESYPNGVRTPLNAKVGDKVLISGYAGVDLTVDGVEYRIVRDVDVVAIFPEED